MTDRPAITADAPRDILTKIDRALASTERPAALWIRLDGHGHIETIMLPDTEWRNALRRYRQAIVDAMCARSNDHG